MITMLSKYFALEEFLVSSSNPQLVRNYKPSSVEIANLTRWALLIGDPIREKFGPVTITSGLRPTLLNEALIQRGEPASRTSQHPYGEAVDFRVRNAAKQLPLVMAYARETLPVWQGIIYYGENKVPQVLHLSIEPRGRETLRPSRSNRWLAKHEGKGFASYNFEETRIV
jgi:hypothetical protein